MITRKALDQLYERIWQYEDTAFRSLLESFIDFSRFGFQFVEKKGERFRSSQWVYQSPYIWLEIMPDMEMIPGIGNIRFFYYRKKSPNRVFSAPLLEECQQYISTSEEFLLCFLEGIPPIQTVGRYKPPIRRKFDQHLTTRSPLKLYHSDWGCPELAYDAAFEAFFWEYYGDRFFRLFHPENQAERDALSRYAYEYYRANYLEKAIREWEEDEKRHKSVPPWKICL